MNTCAAYISILLDLNVMGRVTSYEKGCSTAIKILQQLKFDQLINADLQVTKKGEKYIEMLLKTPLPIQKFGDPRDETV